MERRFADEWARIVPILSAARSADYVTELDLEQALIVEGEVSRQEGGTRDVIQFRFGPEGPLYALTIAGDLMEITAEAGQQRNRVFGPDGRELRSWLQPIAGGESLN